MSQINIRRLLIVVISDFLLVAGLVVGAPGVLKAVEVAGSPELHLEHEVTGDTGMAIPQAIIGPGSVSIVPEKLGVAGLSYTFLATVVPTNTTQPLSYTWEATGQSSVAHISGLTDTVSFTWFVTGTQVVTVTAANSWGAATDAYSIFVSDLPALDTAVAFDISGSMDYETNCFGCWIKDPLKDNLANPYPSNGAFHPLRYEFNEGGGGLASSIFWQDSTSSIADHPVCGALPASKTINGLHYLVHEAEFYARTYPHNGWEFHQRTAGQGFWVLQQTPSAENASNRAYISAHPFVTYSQIRLEDIPQIQGAAYNSDCFAENPDTPGEYGPFGDCWVTKGLPDTANNNVPYVEYDFTPDWTGDLHIWVRAIGGWSWSVEWDGQGPSVPSVPELTPYRTAFFWQIDNGKLAGGEWSLLGRKFLRDKLYTTVASGGKDKWRWVKIADEQLTPNAVSGQQYILRIYQGSTDFNIDKIIITDNPEGVVGHTIIDDGRTVLAVTNDSDVNNAGAATLDSAGNNLAIADDVLSLFNGQGPDATAGSATREACNRCNPAFGETVDPAQCTCRKNASESGPGTSSACTFVDEPVNQLTNDLFYGKAPFRHAKEAVKHFAAQLDPRFDQLGVVAFNHIVSDRTKLQCLVFGGLDLCAEDTMSIAYSFVIKDIEDYENSNATNIAQGLREGLEELGVGVPGYNLNVGHDCPDVPTPISNSPDVLDDDNEEACDRRGATRRVLILLTDGIPNRWPGYPFDPGNCPDDDVALWRGQIGAGHQGFDCAIFFAEAAANNKVALYTIGLGPGTSHELLTAMAEGTDPNPLPGDDGFYFEPHCGQFFHAANLNNLDAIFEQIPALARSCGAAALPPEAESVYLPVILKE